MAQEQFTDVAVIALPLKTKFRGLQTRELVIFRGRERWAEFSPFVEYPDTEAKTWLQAALSWANEPAPKLERSSIRVNATLPAVGPEMVPQLLAEFGRFGSVKIKVAEAGQDLAQDLARIRCVREIYPEVKIRIDANGGYSVAEAMQLAHALGDSELEYMEQPVATISELVELRSELSKAGLEIKIAADESIRKAEDPLLVAQEGAADIAVLKVQPLGGIAKAIDIANSSGLEVVVSSALESSIGLSQGLHLAAALPQLNYDCGLATASLLAGDLTHEPLMAHDGVIEIRELEPSAEFIEKFRTSGEREAWWKARLQRCLELL